MDDVVLNKAATIRRCIARVNEEYAGDPSRLRDDQTRQDSIVLNLQRAVEATIDLAMHLVRKGRLGIPQGVRQVFDLLVDADEITEKQGKKLKRLVGFRNVAVHDYMTLNLDIVHAIIEEHLDDLATFAEHSVRRHG